MKKLTFLLFSLSLTIACTDDKPNSPDPKAPGVKNVWVLNEGNFGTGNSTLGVYDLETEEYSGSVFRSVNNRPLGDVLQSATEIDGEVYLVVNNSGTIEVVDSETFESTATISGLVSPKYIQQVSPSEAYVSDIYSDSITVINLGTNTIDRYINISTGSNEMVMTEGKVFLANTYNTNFITVVDVATEDVSTIATTAEPTSIGLDKNGKVWVLCGGGGTTTDNGALEMIDPASEQLEKTIPLNKMSYTNKLVFNGDRDSLYFLTGDVYKMAITANAAPTTPFIEGTNYSFYGMGYRPGANELWLGDAKNFSQQGDVLIYSSKGNLKSSFTAGIGTNGFWMGE